MTEEDSPGNWKEGFNAALLRFLQGELGKTDAIKVTHFETTRQDRGFCDTCGYSVTVIEITYKDTAGRSRVAEWDGDFGELISRLGE